MRVFEVVLVGLTVVGLLGRGLPRPRIAGPVVALALATVSSLHVVVEGPRWQLVPAYLVAGLVALVGVRGYPARGRPRGRRAVPIAGGLVLVVALGLGVVLPVPALPGPDGPYDVGTTRWEVVDTSRDEPYGDDPGGPRRLMATAWYPTDEPGPASPWVRDPGPFAEHVGAQVGVPAFVLGHLRHVTTTATTDAPLAPPPSEAGWPVVVYSHGWGGFAQIQSDLTEQLASEGYVVLALDHTHGAAVTTFPDGTVAPQDPTALPEAEDVGQAARDEASTRLVATFAADVAFLLDLLDAGDAPPPLHVDDLALGAVALTGHSTGGGAVVRLCVTDERCAGALGLDPWVEPVPEDLRAEGLDVPIVSVRSEAWQGNDNDAQLIDLHAASSDDLGLFVVPGAQHRDFTLLPFLSPIATTLGLSGDVDAAAMHEAIDALTSTFAERVLVDDDVMLPRSPMLVPG